MKKIILLVRDLFLMSWFFFENKIKFGHDQRQ